jgi:hypothetical protein
LISRDHLLSLCNTKLTVVESDVNTKELGLTGLCVVADTYNLS